MKVRSVLRLFLPLLTMCLLPQLCVAQEACCRRVATQEIVVYDVADQTASAKLTAMWGIDYLHLAKFDGKWMVTDILWQTPPRW